MATFHLSNIDRTDLVKILKKLDSQNFCKTMRTCAAICDTITSMEKKTRIRCNGFLGLFLYFDEEEKKLLYDVPINFVKKSDSHESLYPEKLLQSQNELTQVKLEVKKMQLHRKNSCVVLCVSRRKRAFYQKMTPLEVQHLVDNFTFQEFNIITANKSRRVELSAEIIRISSFVKAATLDLAYSDAESMLDDILKKNKSFSALSWGGGFSASAEGTADTWTKFRSISVGMRNVDHYDSIMERIIKGWEAGTSKLQNINCIMNGIPQGVKRFGMKPFLQLTPNYHIHYLSAATPAGEKRFALYSERNFSFHFDDFTACEGCSCSTEFCLTKLGETLKKHWGKDYPEKMDLAKLAEGWNGEDLAAFGAIILGEMENFREKNNNNIPLAN